MMKFSKTTRCFYPSDIAYVNLPVDLVVVTDNDFALALNRAAGETLDVADVREIDGQRRGRIVIIPTAPDTANAAAWAERQAEAASELKFSDNVAIRCLKKGVVYADTDWDMRDDALRNGWIRQPTGDPDLPLPPRPSIFPDEAEAEAEAEGA